MGYFAGWLSVIILAKKQQPRSAVKGRDTSFIIYLSEAE
jgi:hypothetical protein